MHHASHALCLLAMVGARMAMFVCNDCYRDSCESVENALKSDRIQKSTTLQRTPTNRRLKPSPFLLHERTVHVLQRRTQLVIERGTNNYATVTSYNSQSCLTCILKHSLLSRLILQRRGRSSISVRYVSSITYYKQSS